MTQYRGGNVYAVTLHTSTIVASDIAVFPFQAGPNTRVLIEEFIIGIVTDSARSFGIHVFRGSTTPLSTTYVTPYPLGGWTGHSTATSLINNPSTTLPSTTSSVLVHSDVTIAGFRYQYRWRDLELVPGQRIDFNANDLSPVSSSPHIHATLVFREIGKTPIG